MKWLLFMMCGALFAQYTDVKKTELHLHLGGSFPRDFVEGLASVDERERLDGDLGRMARQMNYHDAFDVFAIVRNIVCTEERLKKGTEALCAWLENDGVEYAEIRTGLKDLGGGYEGYLRAMIEGLAGKHAVVLSLKRADTVEKARETVDLAIKYRDSGVVGLDIHDDALKGDIETIMPELLRAKDAGFPIVIHMGESPKETGQLDVLLKLKPARIGHGVHLSKEAEEWMLANRVPLELCMTSAYLVRLVESGEDHPGFRYFRMGHPVVIGSDDPLLFSCTLSQEYKRVQKRAGLSNEEMKQLMLNAEMAILKPKYLYKILTKEAWEESQKSGEIVLSKMDDAFIHFSREDQVDGILDKFFADKDAVVLRVDTSMLEGRLVFECNPGGSTRYYHLYDGCIPFSACCE
jgi:adenosine deaminase